MSQSNLFFGKKFKNGALKLVITNLKSYVNEPKSKIQNPLSYKINLIRFFENHPFFKSLYLEKLSSFMWSEINNNNKYYFSFFIQPTKSNGTVGRTVFVEFSNDSFKIIGHTDSGSTADFIKAQKRISIEELNKLFTVGDTNQTTIHLHVNLDEIKVASKTGNQIKELVSMDDEVRSFFKKFIPKLNDYNLNEFYEKMKKSKKSYFQVPYTQTNPLGQKVERLAFFHYRPSDNRIEGVGVILKEAV